MKILAFETALRECSVALQIDGMEVGYVKSDRISQQSEELFVHIEDLLSKNKLTLANLDAIAVNIGPGSFTGVRIGIAAAKGLKLVLPHLKLIGINSMEILAANYSDSEPAIVILESGQLEYYCQIRQVGEQVSKGRKHTLSTCAPEITKLDNAEINSGSGITCVNKQQLLDLIAENPSAKIISHCKLDFIENADLAEINASVLLKIAAKINANENDISPFYIKSPSISLPKQKE